MADDAARRQEDTEREQRDRAFDLLKHVSTLDIAALVLLIALIENYRKVLLAGVGLLPPTYALFMFGLSLLISVLGLLLFPFIGRDFVIASYLWFFVGVALAVWFTWVNMY